ncbi:uncharacterized protein LOC123507752 [Portunus trituberculatus]|uniref:uncharacterized protein LOC123507752 n=1 Tax=Portunus trituberculatus TaxID=210409 RepID=UPI001E1D1274|nr:uncharacterized protein LOC123507752 [Portunus trituberculatus]
MRQLVVIVALAGVALGMPQGAAFGSDNTFTKILSFESYQDGHNFGHELLQEDGTTAGQKFGPDGLLYGFYSYLQEDGNRVKVLWRAGPGVGYEVIGVEGLDRESLGNLRATVNTNPQYQSPPRQTRPRPVVTSAPVVPQPPIHRAPVQQHRAPVHAPAPNRFIPQTPGPILPHEVTPSPHRFDYPAVLNLERTGQGFVSSLQAV